MTWRSFLDYLLMCELGTPDAVMRNYDLARPSKTSKQVRAHRIACRMYLPKTTDPMVLLSVVTGQLTSYGYWAYDQPLLWARLNEWYQWDRIRTGDIRIWPLKCGPDGRRQKGPEERS
jgi:hypothetical protein